MFRTTYACVRLGEPYPDPLVPNDPWPWKLVGSCAVESHQLGVDYEIFWFWQYIGD